MRTFLQYRKDLREESNSPMIDHGGKLVHTTNSEGLPIHPTEDGIRNFHDWFGDSKATDQHGRPQVLYHGSVNKNINEFDPNITPVRPRSGPNGTYFTSKKEAAYGYSRHPVSSGIKERGSVTPAYLSLKSPLDITKEIKKHEKSGLSFGDAKKKALEKYNPSVHDSIIFRGNGVNPDEYIATHANQIKHTTNNGNFSTKSNIISEINE